MLSNAIIPTEVPEVYRVSFLTHESQMRRDEIICYVRAGESGKLEIYYSHTLQQSRDIPTGSWKTYYQHQSSLRPMLVALIKSEITLALADHFIEDVKILEGDLESLRVKPNA
jgi:hypothetical protein